MIEGRRLAYEQKGDGTQALTDFAKAIELNPKKLDASLFNAEPIKNSPKLQVQIFREDSKILRRELRYANRVNPSALQSSLPTPWCTKNNPSGSYLSLMARSFG